MSKCLRRCTRRTNLTSRWIGDWKSNDCNAQKWLNSIWLKSVRMYRLWVYFSSACCGMSNLIQPKLNLKNVRLDSKILMESIFECENVDKLMNARFFYSFSLVAGLLLQAFNFFLSYYSVFLFNFLRWLSLDWIWIKKWVILSWLVVNLSIFSRYWWTSYHQLSRFVHYKVSLA